MAENPLKPKEWCHQYGIMVNELGLNCLSWSKNLIREEESILAVGCKNIETSPRKVTLGMKVYGMSN